MRTNRDYMKLLQTRDESEWHVFADMKRNISFIMDGGLKKCESFLYNQYNSPEKGDIRSFVDTLLLDDYKPIPFGIDYLLENKIEEEQA